jgi:hypothetical protein
MIGNGKVESKQSHNRTDEPFALARRQPKNRSQCQSCFNGKIGMDNLTACCSARLSSPAGQGFFRKPDCQASSIPQRCVIIPPIGHSMPLTGNVAPALGMKLERHDRPPR